MIDNNFLFFSKDSNYESCLELFEKVSLNIDNNSEIHNFDYIIASLFIIQEKFKQNTEIKVT